MQTQDFMGRTARVHRRVAPALRRVAAALEPFRSDPPAVLSQLGGSFNWRKIAGTSRLSAHAFGIAIDLNPRSADYWRWSSEREWNHAVPMSVVRAFEDNGFIWGGRWYHFDTMHFEYRPEILDCVCRQTDASRACE